MIQSGEALEDGICVIAGEASGDLQAAHLVRALRTELKTIGLGDVPFWGAAGPLLRAEGVHALVRTEDLAVMGQIEVVRSYPRISRAYHDLLDAVDRLHPIAVICVDYPGFNLRFARDAFQRGRIVLYHICPKVWAHGWKRVEALRENTHLVTCILPFEEDMLRKAGLNACFVGNPLRDAVAEFQSARANVAAFRAPGVRRIGIVPGSRRMEIETLMPVLVEALAKLQNACPEFRIEGLLPVAPTLSLEWVRGKVLDAARLIGRDEAWVEASVTFERGGAYPVFAEADYGWVCSGTAALEASFFGMPMSVLYRVHPLTFAIGRRLVSIKWVSLVNLAVQREVVPEFLQEQASAENLVAHARRMLTDPAAREAMCNGLRDVRESFPRHAFAAASRQMVETLRTFALPEDERFRLHRRHLLERLGEVVP